MKKSEATPGNVKENWGWRKKNKNIYLKMYRRKFCLHGE